MKITLKKNKAILALSLVTLFGLLVGCGGGSVGGTNPVPTPTPGVIITGGGASVTFSGASGTNANTTNRNLAIVPGVITNVLGIKQFTATASASGTGDTSGTIQFGIMGAVSVGTFTIDDDKYQVTYTQGTPGTNQLQWHASGGKIQIVSVDASKVSFKIIGATMVKDTTTANGTFTLDATGDTTSLLSL